MCAGTELPFAPSLVTADVSFISLSKLLGPIASVASEDLDLLAMVHPGVKSIPTESMVRSAIGWSLASLLLATIKY